MGDADAFIVVLPLNDELVHSLRYSRDVDETNPRRVRNPELLLELPLRLVHGGSWILDDLKQLGKDPENTRTVSEVKEQGR